MYAVGHGSGFECTLISIMIFFFSTKKTYIDTEPWEQRPNRCALAPEFELEFFLSRKKKTVIMEIRVMRMHVHDICIRACACRNAHIQTHSQYMHTYYVYTYI